MPAERRLGEKVSEDLRRRAVGARAFVDRADTVPARTAPSTPWPAPRLRRAGNGRRECRRTRSSERVALA
jgi:hypothetical protein